MDNFLYLINRLDFSNIMWQIMTPLIFSLGDIVTGYIQAIINKNVDSQKMRAGLLHKSLIIILIILSFVIEFAFNIKGISSVVSVYVVIMELVSILENLKKGGIDIGRIGNILKQKTDIDAESVNNLVNTIDNVIKKESESDDDV